MNKEDVQSEFERLTKDKSQVDANIVNLEKDLSSIMALIYSFSIWSEIQTVIEYRVLKYT